MTQNCSLSVSLGSLDTLSSTAWTQQASSAGHRAEEQTLTAAVAPPAPSGSRYLYCHFTDFFLNSKIGGKIWFRDKSKKNYICMCFGFLFGLCFIFCRALDSFESQMSSNYSCSDLSVDQILTKYFNLTLFSLFWFCYSSFSIVENRCSAKVWPVKQRNKR